jgi:hypothetical protein
MPEDKRPTYKVLVSDVGQMFDAVDILMIHAGKIIPLAMETPEKPLSYALLLHLQEDFRRGGTYARDHKKARDIEYRYLQEIARKRGYGDISFETLERFSPVGKETTREILHNSDMVLSPVQIVPIPVPKTDEETSAKKFFDKLLGEEPQYRLDIDEETPLVEYRESNARY